MKTLLIDAGSSRVKWCRHDAGAGLAAGYQSEDYDALERQGLGLFAGLFEGGGKADAVIVCSVGGKAPAKFFTQLFAPWRVKPKFARPARRSGAVINGYKQPGQLGADRWMALLGAWEATRGAVCVADCGTAVTFDALDREGRHQGGLIVPGIASMHDALARNTALRPTVQLTKSDTLLPTDTNSAITAGVFHMVADFIEDALYRVADDLGLEDMPLILTGGDAELIEELLDCEATVDPMLVFKGMLVHSAAAA